MKPLEPGTEAYIIENNMKVAKIIIKKYAGGFYTVQMADGSGGTRLREHRIYRTEEEAAATLPKKEKKPSVPFWLH